MQIPLSLDQVFTVSELNSEVKWLLDTQFGSVWVEGELSNTMRARTGHMYFSMKDSRSQLRCAMFSNDNRRLDFTPQDGQKVLCRGRLGIYEARGDYQMVVDRMVETGAGALQKKFEETKKRLHAEGLFDDAHKQPLPVFPTTIGLITSPTGAALRDVLNVLQRRFACANVIVYPATVQGKSAAGTIANMLEIANQRKECDVLLLIRGGGSIEDLWSFNEEIVARAIHKSSLPIVCGVGHEIDYTIADLAADVRAPTPSAAAELCSPERQELLLGISQMRKTLTRQLQGAVAERRAQMAQWQKRLSNVHPQNRLQQRVQRCDELETRLRRCLQNAISRSTQHQSQLSHRLTMLSPRHQISRRTDNLKRLQTRLTSLQQMQLQRAALRLSGSQRALHAISPLNTLARGYAIVHDNSGKVVSRSSEVAPLDNIKIRLASGELEAKVTDTKFTKTQKT